MQQSFVPISAQCNATPGLPLQLVNLWRPHHGYASHMVPLTLQHQRVILGGACLLEYSGIRYIATIYFP